MAPPPPDPVGQGHSPGPGQERGPALTELFLKDRDETEALGEAVGLSGTAAGLVVAFRGDLGAGKTVMAKGVARGLGITDEVTSPTFTIISEYSGRLRLHHIDAWRLGGWTDFQEIGGEDLLDDQGAICLVEWSERLAGDLPRDAEVVELSVEADGRRRARITGPRLEAIARAFLEGRPGERP